MMKDNNQFAAAILLLVALLNLYSIYTYSQVDSTYEAVDSVVIDTVDEDVPIVLDVDSKTSAIVDSMAQARFRINFKPGHKYALFDCRTDSVVSDDLDAVNYSHSFLATDSSAYCYFYFEKGLMQGLIGLSLDGNNKVTMSQYNPRYVASLDECTTIDSALTKKCKEALQEGMKSMDGVYGQLAVVDVLTGRLKTWVAMRLEDNEYEEGELLRERVAGSRLLLPINVAFTMLRNNLSLEDTVDTGNGIYEYVKDHFIKDDNWRSGGYGKITFLQGLERKSNVAMFKAIERIEPTDVIDTWQSLDVTDEESNAMEIASAISGMYWYGDHYVWPSLIGDSVTIEPNTDYSPKFHQYIKRILTDMNTDNGSQAKLAPKNVSLVGIYGITNELRTKVDGTIAQLSFCGCFPADKPRYAIGAFIDKSPKGIIIYPQLSKVVNEIIEWLSTNGKHQ